MPKTMPSATVETSDETAIIYEWALGEYKTNADGEYAKDSNGELIPINPISFPLVNAHVIVNGSRATISVPRHGKPNATIDKLSSVPDPKAAGPGGRRRKGGDDTGLILTGVSERMVRQGISPEDAVVTFTVRGSNVTERRA